MIKDRMNQLLEKQSRAIKIMDEVEKEASVLEKECNKVVNEKLNKYFPNQKFYLLGSFSGGIATDNWKPRITLYEVNGARYTDQDTWVKNEVVIEGNNGIHVVELEVVLNNLQEELGIPVYLYKHHVKTAADVKVIRDAKDLQLKYPGIDVLVDGKIWYVGWDICDIFFITKYKNQFMLFLSDNGHGQGIDYVYEKNSDVEVVSRFFDSIEKDSANNAYRNQYFNRIVGNWQE